MLKLEKNLFYEAMKTANFDSSLFSAEDVSAGLLGHARYTSGLEIRVIGTPLLFRTTKFEAAFDGRNYRCEATRFDPDLEEVTAELEGRHYRGEYNMPVNDAAACFGEWLRSDVGLYFQERDAPDMWRQLTDMQALAHPSLDDDDFFTEGQKAFIRNAALPQIRMFIVERFQPDRDVLERIDDRLDYLAAAVDRPKFDFHGLLLGFALSVATTLFLSKEDGTALLDFIADAFSSVSRLIGG